MRYYDIQLIKKGDTKPFRQWTSYPNGNFDPNSPLVEFNVQVYPFHEPAGGSVVTIHGVSLQDLTNAQQFGAEEMTLTLSGGMKSGLPLANPKQAGPLISGQVWQSFGNWEGTEMTLDLIVYPTGYSIDNPGNIVLNWTAEMDLGTALNNCLTVAFPGVKITTNLASGYVLNHDQPGAYRTVEELGAWVFGFTEQQFGRGVSIAFTASGISIFDSSKPSTAIQINFNDLIGQPTWVDINTMSVKFAMRADLQVGSLIKMPQGMQSVPGMVQTSANSSPSKIKYKSAFEGQFIVNELRHIGNSRTPDGASWATVANCIVYQN